MSVAGESEIQLSQIEADPGVAGGVWIWGVADSLRLAATNAVRIAEELVAKSAITITARAQRRHSAIAFSVGARKSAMRGFDSSGGNYRRLVLTAGCGYQVAGKAAHLPSEWKTIADSGIHKRHDPLSHRAARSLRQSSENSSAGRNIASSRIRTRPMPFCTEKFSSIEASPVLFNGTTGEVTTMLVT